MTTEDLFKQQTDEEREFLDRLREADERAAKKREERERAEDEKTRAARGKAALSRAADIAAKNAAGTRTLDKIPLTASAQAMPEQAQSDPAPEKETGMYRVHIIHRELNLEFDMLLNPKRAGAAIYHGATITIKKKDDAQQPT